MEPKQVEAAVRQLLESDFEDLALRDRLEELAKEQSFAGFTWLWGPVLYKRAKVTFRPFILNHFATMLSIGTGARWRWERVDWSAEAAASLDPWLEEVDRQNDADLFRRLYAWKYVSQKRGGLDEETWRRDLLDAFRKVATTSERNLVLSKYDLWGSLDEDTALALYTLDPTAARSFILKHPLWRIYPGGGDKRRLPIRLMQRVQERGDEEFYFELYRKTVPLNTWTKDVHRLTQEITDPDQLNVELHKRHPEGWWLDLASSFVALLRQRGRDVFPYLFKHLSPIRAYGFGKRYGELLELARSKGWWDLWGALLRTCANAQDYDAEIARLIKDRNTPEKDVLERLRILCGVSREWNFGPFGLAMVHQLTDDTAVALYKRFPTLLRGPFRLHIAGSWYGVLPKLLDAALANDDETLLDFQASRMITRVIWTGPHAKTEELQKSIDKLADYYENLKKKPADFSWRAGIVLSQVPAYTISRGYNELIRTNRLARSFFERSTKSLLAEPGVVRDLLEAPEIHVQALALRALGLDDDRARVLAVQTLNLLQATLLRPLHRKTRSLAFAALANAAVHDADAAKRILARARDAFDLPDKGYPKENLIGLIAQILARWPDLRGEREKPLVYRK